MSLREDRWQLESCTRFDISNFPGEKALQSLVNSLLKTRLREELTKVIENKVKDAAATWFAGDFH